MKTVTDHIREHVLLTAGCIERKPLPDLDSLHQSEWFPEFEQLMRNRLIMGAFRYQLFKDKACSASLMFEYLKQKVAVYEKTGNREALVDIANMAGLEFMFPSHPNAHWAAGDDDSSHCQVLDHLSIKTNSP